jgi:hypothetical protein
MNNKIARRQRLEQECWKGNEDGEERIKKGLDGFK